jgi:ribosome biogenesis protein NSA1
MARFSLTDFPSDSLTRSIITCTNTGALTVQNIQDRSKTSTLSVGEDICRMRVHPREHHVVATAGKEQELTIWDLSVLLKGPETPKKGKGKKDAKAPVEKKAPHKSKEILSSGQIFKAKNVKNDHLDLRVPVWNTDLQFLNQFDITRIAVGTRHHQIRVYDTKGARRPAVDAEVGTMPVVALANGKDASEVVFSDTVTNVYSVDTLTGAILGQYKGNRGLRSAIEGDHCFRRVA